MKNSSGVLNNIMNRDTYVTGKCGTILGEILIQDFEKIYHNTQEYKIKKFLSQTLETIHRKVFLHLTMNNMTKLEIINLDDDVEINNNNYYFFYKIDGLENFARGIKNFSIVTGIIEKGHLFCFTCYIPSINSMIWYQEENNLIYLNNTIIWSPTSLLKTNRENLMINIFLKNYNNYIFNNENKFMITNNFFYDLFLLLNDSIDQLITDVTFNSIEKIIFNEFINIGAITIREENNCKLINKKLISTKSL